MWALGNNTRFDICSLSRLGKRVALERVIAVLEKALCPAIAALGHMIRNIGKHETGESSHAADNLLFRVFSKLAP